MSKNTVISLAMIALAAMTLAGFGWAAIVLAIVTIVSHVIVLMASGSIF